MLKQPLALNLSFTRRDYVLIGSGQVEYEAAGGKARLGNANHACIYAVPRVPRVVGAKHKFLLGKNSTIEPKVGETFAINALFN